jgi:MFS family permease
MVAINAVLVYLPGAMEIAPWAGEEVFHDSTAAPADRRILFVKLALIGNLASFMMMGNYRGLLAEYTSDPAVNIEGWRYGLLMGATLLGMVTANGFLMRWHEWHYNLFILLGGELFAALGLAAFFFTDTYWLLVLIAFLLGLPAGLLYFSAFFYGMSELEKKGAHGGNHESIIGTGMAVGPLLGGLVILLCKSRGFPSATRANLLMCAVFFLLAMVVQFGMAKSSKGWDDVLEKRSGQG